MLLGRNNGALIAKVLVSLMRGPTLELFDPGRDTYEGHDPESCLKASG